MHVLVILASQDVSARILNLPRHFLHRPLERYAIGCCALQGGGLAIFGTATLTNTNVYSNTASGVRARLSNLQRVLSIAPLN